MAKKIITTCFLIQNVQLLCATQLWQFPGTKTLMTGSMPNRFYGPTVNPNGPMVLLDFTVKSNQFRGKSHYHVCDKFFKKSFITHLCLIWVLLYGFYMGINKVFQGNKSASGPEVHEQWQKRCAKLVAPMPQV